MQLPLSSKLAGSLVWRNTASSTNLELIQLSQSENLPDFTVMVTANQVAGRGRSGRVWEAPANASLAISILLRPRLNSPTDTTKLGWLPLLAGLAMSENVRELLADSGSAHAIGVKWPNDVLVNDLKVCGVLSELVTGTAGGGVAVVVGAGINLSQAQEQLPVDTATSLELQGAKLPFLLEERFDRVLSGYLEQFRIWYEKFTDAQLNAVTSGLRAAVLENCVSLGREVRAILPGDSELQGRAATIDDTGRIVIDVAGLPTPVAAGDIVHLRHR